MALRIKPDHLEHLKAVILPHVNNHLSDYRSGNFPRADRCKDLHKRFSFDLLYAYVGSQWVCDNLYSYMNDQHLYSALKSFVPDPGARGN